MINTHIDAKSAKGLEDKNKCAFCGRKTDFYYWELACYICPTCLGEYRKALATPEFYDDYSTFYDDYSTNKRYDEEI